MLNAAPAAPRTFGPSGSKLAWMLMSMLLSSAAPHRSAANWKAMRRCWPFVVPGLPPTGAAGVGALKPSLGPSALIIVMCALADAGAGIAKPTTATTRVARLANRLMMSMALLPSARLGCLRQEGRCLFDRAHALHVDRAVFIGPADENVIESVHPQERCTGGCRRLAFGACGHPTQRGHEFPRFLFGEIAQPAGVLVDADLAARQLHHRIVDSIVLLRLHSSARRPQHQDGGEPETEGGDTHPSPRHMIAP